jgi:TolB-like protein
MKKFLLVSVLFAVLAVALPAQEMSLGEVIVRSARNVEEALPQGTMVAVLNFASTSETFSDYVIEELTGELVTGRKVAIVDRRSLSLIREEMNLQLSGEVSDESAQAIGRLLGAQSIVSGNLTNMGTYYRFRVRVISVQTALIQTQVSLDLRNDSRVAFLLGGSQTNAPPVASTPRQRPARESQPAQPPATPATPKEPAESRQPAQPSDKAANARNNWISAELDWGFTAGIGARYERMLSSRISLGTIVYWGFFSTFDAVTPNGFGIDASFRWYPWGKTFFAGIALGFSTCSISIMRDDRERSTTYQTGFAITPEIGWKIDIGNPGGFFMQIGVAGSLVFGKEVYKIHGVEKRDEAPVILGYNSRGVYFGMGYAF